MHKRIYDIQKSIYLSILVLAAISVYGTPGTLDRSFSGDGLLTDWTGSAFGVALQTDGKIVVVGTTQGSTSDFAVARYNVDGSRDASFGGGTGRVTTDLGGYDTAFKVAIQPDGRIVVVGTWGKFDDGGIALTRYNPDGSLDMTFGDGSGKLLTETPFGCERYSYGSSSDLVVLPDGSIVGLVGYNDVDGNCLTDGIVFRYTSEGVLDPTFGTNGRFTAEFPLWSLALKPSDGKIILAGYEKIIRLNPNGSPDAGFGSNGTFDLPTGSSPSDVAIQPNGKIVIAGRGMEMPNGGWSVARLNANGSLDTSFGGDGIITVFQGYDSASSVVIQPDGKILCTGSVSGSVAGNGFGLARFNSDGSADLTIWGAGWIVVDFDDNDFDDSADYPREIVLDNAGRAVVVGESQGTFALARFVIAPFEIAPNFSISGRVLTPAGVGVRSAAVTLTDAVGNRRSTLTSSLGYYSFADIAAGETITIAALSRRYRFQTVTRTLNESLSDVDLVGME